MVAKTKKRPQAGALLKRRVQGATRVQYSQNMRCSVWVLALLATSACTAVA